MQTEDEESFEAFEDVHDANVLREKLVESSVLNKNLCLMLIFADWKHNAELTRCRIDNSLLQTQR